ncbi:hypothetical protein [Bacteroides sp.]
MAKVDISKLDNSQYSIQGYGEPVFVVKNAMPMSFGICFYGIILRDVTIGGDIKLLLSDADGNRYDVTCLNITLEREADCSTVYTEPQLCEAGELAHITINYISNLEFTKGPVCFYMSEEKNKKEDFRSHFKITDDEDVIACGIPGLNDENRGRNWGDNIAAFWGNGRALTLVNMQTGKVRKFVDKDGWLLVEDKDIDYDSIHQHHEHYHGCVDHKYVKYGFNRYDDFKNGLCALVWTTYPDGRYFADEDGFGMEDNDEEEVYCVINTDLEIIVPFQPMDDVKSVLRKIASNGF